MKIQCLRCQNEPATHRIENLDDILLPVCQRCLWIAQEAVYMERGYMFEWSVL